MTEPITLALVGSAVLTEGIKFLYGQAGDLLRFWREQKKNKAPAPEATQTSSIVPHPCIFEGSLNPLSADLNTLKPWVDLMQVSWSHLAPYAEGIKEIDSTNSALLKATDELRSQLEAVYGQRITFKGEPRERSGVPVIVGNVEAREIAGHASGVSAGSIASGSVVGGVKAETIAAGATAEGVRVDVVGGGFARSRS